MMIFCFAQSLTLKGAKELAFFDKAEYIISKKQKYKLNLAELKMLRTILNSESLPKGEFNFYLSSVSNSKNIVQKFKRIILYIKDKKIGHIYIIKKNNEPLVPSLSKENRQIFKVFIDNIDHQIVKNKKRQTKF